MCALNLVFLVFLSSTSVRPPLSFCGRQDIDIPVSGAVSEGRKNWDARHVGESCKGYVGANKSVVISVVFGGFAVGLKG